MVDIPPRMKSLPRDKRGFPIPCIVMIDPNGDPAFMVNDSVIQRRCTLRKLCPICGGRLTKELWFSGGPMSAFHPRGGYIDSAAHHECLIFALQTCPYLAMPNYRSTMEVRLPQLEKRLEGTTLVDHTVIPDRAAILADLRSDGAGN